MRHLCTWLERLGIGTWKMLHMLIGYEEFSYAVESDGFLSLLFFFLVFFLAWQGLHTQHRMQGEASSSSGDVTSTMMLTPTSIPTT